MATCSVSGCDKPALARGWCSKHWTRWQRHGDPLAGGTPKDGTVKRYFYNVVVPYAGDDCLVWPFGRDSYGYGKIYLDDGSYLVHRRACEEVYGDPPDGDDIHAAHSCGNGHLGCCNPKHLRWAERASNERDKIEHGTSNRGSRHGMAILTEEQVLKIRSSEGSIPRSELAIEFGVSPRTIRDIHSRRSWSWLPSPAANDNNPKQEAA